MDNSPTEDVTTQSASQEHTEQVDTQQSAESQSQDTNPEASTQSSTGEVSDSTAKPSEDKQSTEQKQTEQKGGESESDDDLAKFARGQGYTDEEIESMSDREKKTLASYRKTVTRSRNQSGQKASELFSGGDVEQRVAALEAEKVWNSFLSEEGRNPDLEQEMLNVAMERKEKFGENYAYSLSQDLEALYAIAESRKGGSGSTDEQAIRKSERESINKQLSASPATAHATQQVDNSKPPVDSDWIKNEYNPRNPEHIKLLDAYMASLKE